MSIYRRCSHCGETVPEEYNLLACPRQTCSGTILEHSEAMMSVADYVRLRDAAVTVLEGFEKGIFIRQTRDDIHADWAVKALRYIQALAVLQIEVRHL